MQTDKKGLCCGERGERGHMRGKRRRLWSGRKGGGGWRLKNCLRLAEEGGRVEQCYEWIESLTPQHTE